MGAVLTIRLDEELQELLDKACGLAGRTHNDPAKAVNYGAAHGALAMTTPGDTTMVTVKEVEKVMAGGGARVVR